MQLGWMDRTLEDADSGGEVVDSAGGLEGSGDNGDGGDQVVSESVVQVALKLENILDRVELLLVSVKIGISLRK